jgi:RND family efflux transporter MFP subunit
VISVVASEPARDGLFIPVKAFESAGTYTGRIRVNSPQVEDDFEFGIVVIHADQRGALAAAAAEAADEPAGAIPFLLESQWPMDFLLEQARSKTLVKRLLVPGETVAASGAAAAVSPPVAGRLLPPPSGDLPRIGDRVTAGQVLGSIEPPLPLTEAMQLAANEASIKALETELMIKELDLNIKGLEVQQAITQARTRLEFAQRAFERIANLKEQGLRTDEQYDAANHAAELVEAELSGALQLKASFEQAVAKLQEIRSVSRSSSLEGHSGSPLHLPVRAPITGTIVEVAHIEGEYVEPTDELYRIINDDTIWVVAHVSEFDLADLTDSPQALLSLPAYPDESLDISQLGGRLINAGIAVDQATRTLPLVYELPNRRGPQGRLQIGLLVDVHLGTRAARDVVSIPVSAIIPDSGRPTVYVLLDGEHFQRREVVLGIRDGGYVEITNGVNEGDWVVARGGNAVRLAALSPASFGAGHAH